MQKNFISIIIPTYNRSETLIKCLKALFNQSYPKSQYEIIIVNDGSIDNTEQKVKSLIENTNYLLKYLKQENKGPATARNLGIKNAKGNIILFIGDDIIPAPHFLEEHSNWHKKYSQKEVAILGYTTWSPELEITSYMKWLENGGPQFHYQNLKHGEFVPYNYFYTSNISIKRNFLNGDLFNELFPYAAYEDIELSFRLQKRGLKIIYNKNARAFHFHKIDLKNYSKRAINAGIARALLAKLHKNFSINKKWNKEIILFNKITMPFWLLIGEIYETKKINPKLFRKIYNYYFNKGIRIGLKQNKR
jgi:glycosyltransferase involved in cell wall biosynthesis